MTRRALCALALLPLLLAGCGRKETVYYLPQEQVPVIDRNSRYEALPVQEEPDGKDSVVTPFVPFD